MNAQQNSSSVFYRRIAHPHPKIIQGEGTYLFDENGKSYIDGAGGAIVVNTGHGIPEIAEAIQRQATQAAYVHPTLFTTDSVEDYAHQLAKITPMDDPRFYFQTSGSEATETALKLARQIQVERGEHGRYISISRWMSYHGLSMGALAATGKQKMRKLYQPMFRDTPHIPPPYCYRCPYQLKHPECSLKCADALEEEILTHTPETISAFLFEPVSGATIGAVVPPDGYLQRIQQICDHYGVLLIADEVMTGMGRTGKWFGVEHWNIQPDIMTIGKGTTGGYFPLSAIAAKGEHYDLIASKGDFLHGGTYSHHAVGTAAGLAVLKYLKEHQLVEQVPEKGAILEKLLREQFENHPHVGDIRGIGLMWGIEFVKDKDNKQPFDYHIHLAQKIADIAFDLGLIVYPGSGCVDGYAGDHIMLGPPFCITNTEITKMITILADAVEKALQTALINK